MNNTSFVKGSFVDFLLFSRFSLGVSGLVTDWFLRF